MYPAVTGITKILLAVPTIVVTMKDLKVFLQASQNVKFNAENFPPKQILVNKFGLKPFALQTVYKSEVQYDPIFVLSYIYETLKFKNYINTILNSV